MSAFPETRISTRRSSRRTLRRWVGAGAATVITAGSLAVASSAHAATFTTVTAPLTSASDYLTGLPSCGLGPVGLLPETGSFIVTDYCNATTYRYDTSGA